MSILLTTAVVATLSPYLAKGAEEISKSVAKDLYESIKKKFSSPKEKGLLEKFEINNADKIDIDVFKNSLTVYLENSSFLDEVVQNLFKVLNKLLDEDRLPEFFAITDGFIVDNQYSRLKREYISNRTDFSFSDRLRVYLKTYFSNHFQ